jgi:hypothetical protein
VESVATTEAPLYTINDALYVDGGVQIVGPSPWADVTAFGAVPSSTCTRGDGGPQNTDNAISAALTKLLPTGGTLFFPPGTYCITRTIALSQGSITLAGAGNATTILGPTDANIGPLVQVAGSGHTVRDLALNCNLKSHGISFGGTGSPIVQGNALSHLSLVGCTTAAGTNAIEFQPGSQTAENGVRDILITNYGSTASGGAGIYFAALVPDAGYVTDNTFANITVNNTPGTVGVDIEGTSPNNAGASGNNFSGLNISPGGPPGGGTSRDILIASGAADNHFNGVTFDNDSDASVHIENHSTTTEFFGTNTYAGRVVDTTGAMTLVGQADNSVQMGGYAYSSTNGIVELGGAGVHLNSGTTVTYGNALSVQGPDAGLYKTALTVGAPIPNTGIATEVSMSAPNANWGPTVTVMTDGVGRGLQMVTQGYNYVDAGQSLSIGLSSNGAQIVASTGGSSALAPIKFTGSYLYVGAGPQGNPGMPLVLKGSDGTCVGLSVSGGALAATNNFTPCP